MSEGLQVLSSNGYQEELLLRGATVRATSQVRLKFGSCQRRATASLSGVVGDSGQVGVQEEGLDY